ncbi:hypothetical protein XENOCAPTIV_022257 [Xenoophorus captivus]|uniref:Uncharacterized protein n=1 Tax=Xenoophorus captivus TaxID=1517983 RepID=A0ABV0QJK3_9TELE
MSVGESDYYLDDLTGLHGQSGEVSSAVDGDSLPQDRVQSLHLIPRQHTEPPSLIRSSRHFSPNSEKNGLKKVINKKRIRQSSSRHTKIRMFLVESVPGTGLVKNWRF